MRIAMVLACVLVACGDDTTDTSAAGAGGSASTTTSTSSATTGGAGGVPALGCDPLPPARGTVVTVSPSQAGELPDIVATAAPGSTIALEDGDYALGASLRLSADGVTLRGASGDAEKVVLDGAYRVAETVVITGSNVTVSDVTIARAIDHPIHVYPPGPGIDVVGTHIYRTRLVDGGEQFIKVNPIQGELGWVDDGRVECSIFELTDEGRTQVEPCCGGCYTGGIDAHSAWRWQVRHNIFRGIYCATGLAEHAVHFWRGSRDTLVENNVIVDCARGIGFGLGSGTGERVYPDMPHGRLNLAHYDGIIRNNTIWADIAYFDTGIEIQDAREPVVVHNTVMSSASATAFFSSIDYRFAQTLVVMHNNLTVRITQRDGAMGTVSHNLEATPLSYFMAPPGDLHLTRGADQAIDQGLTLDPTLGGLDLDGMPHDAGSAPDLGADER